MLPRKKKENLFFLVFGDLFFCWRSFQKGMREKEKNRNFTWQYFLAFFNFFFTGRPLLRSYDFCSFLTVYDVSIFEFFWLLHQMREGGGAWFHFYFSSWMNGRIAFRFIRFFQSADFYNLEGKKRKNLSFLSIFCDRDDFIWIFELLDSCFEAEGEVQLRFHFLFYSRLVDFSKKKNPQIHRLLLWRKVTIFFGILW